MNRSNVILDWSKIKNWHFSHIFSAISVIFVTKKSVWANELNSNNRSQKNRNNNKRLRCETNTFLAPLRIQNVIISLDKYRPVWVLFVRDRRVGILNYECIIFEIQNVVIITIRMLFDIERLLLFITPGA